jgi:hypothetical protein
VAGFISDDCLESIRTDIEGDLFPHVASSIRRIYQGADAATAVDAQGEPVGDTEIATNVPCHAVRFTNSVLYNMFLESGDKQMDKRGYIINFPYEQDILITDEVTIDGDIYKITSVDESGLVVRKTIAKLMN